MGRTQLKQRKGASDKELKTYAWLDVNIGMVLSDLVMYFIILDDGGDALFTAGKHDVQSACRRRQSRCAHWRAMPRVCCLRWA